jgi:Na+-transporting methylmalonyl-CoA/oxaloacetate decarboxylase beta subunit
MGLVSTQKERAACMDPKIRELSKLERVRFPVGIFIVAALFVPKSVPIIGMLMFGNLLRVTGVTDSLAESAGTVPINVLTFCWRFGGTNVSHRGKENGPESQSQRLSAHACAGAECC